MNIEEIYLRHVDTVYRLCMMYLKKSYEAEDAVSQTFMNLLNHPRSFDNEDHEKAWLIVTASNVCKNQLQHWFQKKRTDFEDVKESLSTTDVKDEMLELVLNLPDELKTIIYMYYYEGYQTDEIAKHMNINHSTVRSRMSKARELLKMELGGSDD